MRSRLSDAAATAPGAAPLTGIDDQTSARDRGYDDLVVRASLVSAVPEPGTRAMLLLGSGGVATHFAAWPQAAAARPVA